MTAAPPDDASEQAKQAKPGRLDDLRPDDPRNVGTMVFDADEPPPRREGPRQAEAVAAIKPGALLGRFEITRRLGGGGMGEVFLAHDPDLDRDVAIKVLSGPAAADPAARKRFLLEGRAAGRLSHPNVVAIHEVGPPHLADCMETHAGDGDETSGDASGEPPRDAGRDAGAGPADGLPAELDGPVYLVMDYACDGSVDQLLRAGPLSVEQATAVVADAAAGLAAAHAAGLVHRDVKPANLMLEGGGPWAGGAVKVADFGLARRTGELARKHEVRHDGEAEASSSESVSRRVRRKVAGTPHFMSPEQCRGESVDERSDLYSLGATYYALIAGRPPFAAAPGAPSRPVTAILNAHKNADPPPVHELGHLGAAVPSACTRIILRAMAKDPADRYAGAAAFRKDAQALLDALQRRPAAPHPPARAEGPADPLPLEFLLPSERGSAADSHDSAWESQGSASSLALGSGAHDPAADTPPAGTSIDDLGEDPHRSLVPAWGPPPGLRREIFSLADGEVTLSYPASLKNASLGPDELDRLRAWLNLVRIKLTALAEERPKP